MDDKVLYSKVREVQVSGASEKRVLILINSELYFSGVAGLRGADAPTPRGKTHRDARV